MRWNIMFSSFSLIYLNTLTHTDTLASVAVYLAVSLIGQGCRTKKSCQAGREWHIGRNADTLSHACAYFQYLHSNMLISYTNIRLICDFLTIKPDTHWKRLTTHVLWLSKYKPKCVWALVQRRDITAVDVIVLPWLQRLSGCRVLVHTYILAHSRYRQVKACVLR